MKNIVISPLFFYENICGGAHWKRLNETIPMSTHHMFSWRNKGKKKQSKYPTLSGW